MSPSSNQEIKTPSDTYWRVRIFESLGTSLFFSFRLVLERKMGKEMPQSSRLEILEKFLLYNFALSDAKDRRGITDLPLLRTLLGICQKSWEPSFWELMYSFVSLAYVSVAASRILLQLLLDCLNFPLDSEDLFCWYKQKKWFQWTRAAAAAAENHGNQWGLTWYFGWGIILIPAWTLSQNWLAAAEALS